MTKALNEYTYGKKATWIVTARETLEVKCSECSYTINYFWNDWQNAKFCPNCGAIMDGDKNVK